MLRNCDCSPQRSNDKPNSKCQSWTDEKLDKTDEGWKATGLTTKAVWKGLSDQHGKVPNIGAWIFNAQQLTFKELPNACRLYQTVRSEIYRYPSTANIYRFCTPFRKTRLYLLPRVRVLVKMVSSDFGSKSSTLKAMAIWWNDMVSGTSRIIYARTSTHELCET